MTFLEITLAAVVVVVAVWALLLGAGWVLSKIWPDTEAIREEINDLRMTAHELRVRASRAHSEEEAERLCEQAHRFRQRAEILRNKHFGPKEVL